jgi:hypothetical protein
VYFRREILQLYAGVQRQTICRTGAVLGNRLTLEFGRPVRADTLVLTTRADFPHDAWWKSARVTLSNGDTRILTLEKSPEGKGQSFDLGGFVITSLLLDNLKKANDPSPFPALTQLEVWGTNV